MKPANRPRNDVLLPHLLSPDTTQPRPRPQQATAPEVAAATSPVLRIASAPAADLFASLPLEVCSLINHRLAARVDRAALAQTSHNQYTTDHPQRQLDFFVTHCHQIATLPGQQIAGFTASALSQPLLTAVPGTALLVSLFKLHCLLDKNPQAAAEPAHQLGQISGAQLRTAFRLFAHWAQAYAPDTSDTMPFVNADFLASAPLLARVDQLAVEEGSLDTVLALTDALLSWTEQHGSQHFLIAGGGQSKPPTWCALATLAEHLVQHGDEHPEDASVTPELLLQLTSWCHFVQESGLLLSEASDSPRYAYSEFSLLKLEYCIPVLLDRLAKAQHGQADQTLHLAGQLLARQAAAHRTQPPNVPHMASLRVLTALMQAGAAEIAAGSPQGLALLGIAIAATRHEFARFAHTVYAHPVAGFHIWNESDPELPELDLDDDDMTIGWECVSELIAFHTERIAVDNADSELMDKLYGYAHDLANGMHDPVRGLVHSLSDEQTCRLRLVDSMLATLRDLSLILATVPATARAALADDLRAIVRLWPMEHRHTLLEDWIPRTP